MPVKITKGKKGYRVSTPGGVKAKGTTKAKAEAQANLLRGVEHGWKPTGKPAKPKAKGGKPALGKPPARRPGRAKARPGKR